MEKDELFEYYKMLQRELWKLWPEKHTIKVVAANLRAAGQLGDTELRGCVIAAERQLWDWGEVLKDECDSRLGEAAMYDGADVPF